MLVKYQVGVLLGFKVQEGDAGIAPTATSYKETKGKEMSTFVIKEDGSLKFRSFIEFFVPLLVTVFFFGYRELLFWLSEFDEFMTELERSALGFGDLCVIAVAKQRGIDVLLNDESNCETSSVISVGEKQWFLGSAGAASATMNPKSTISQVKRLIGLNFRQPDVQDEQFFFPFETSEAADGGIRIHLQYLGEILKFTPVQILAMLFPHLKQMVEKNLENPISDCVIGIPSYFTELQRRGYLNAA
ncbi:hypothetical protein NE237_021141 [Protea cynaroides]|uniref:Uncharacterized protein n=1 Tax=Protea cynaroides TaxID=273540 RepID=A0A9Q0K304_9MAGN|nr:hypothetical protein NE237_021141 [Protea cynaroides]